MTKWLKRALWLTVAALVFVYGAWLALSLTFRVECNNRVLTEVQSDDRLYTATLFERNCGATTPFATIVGLRAAGTDFDAESKEDWLVALSGRTALRLRWAGGRQLVIQGAGGEPDAQIRSSWQDVKVTFE